MAGYFSYFPDLYTVSRMTDRSSNSEFVRVKNLFRRPKLRDDLMSVTTAFEDYMVIGDQRPEEVAYKLYGDPRLDWVVLTTNNITKVQDEWPLNESDFRKFVLDKYGSEEKAQEIHYYITETFIDDKQRVVVPEGLVVDSNFNASYLERNQTRQTEVSYSSGTLNELSTVDEAGTVKDSNGNTVTHNNVFPVTHYEWEISQNDAKRRIRVLKPDFLDIVVSDMSKIMKYKKSSDFMDKRVKMTYNPRLSGH